MADVTLHAIDEGMELALDEPARFSAMYGQVSADDLELVRGVVEHSVEFQAGVAADEPWCGYLTVSAEEGAVVGSCAFKGGPDPEGCVEIAYYTLPTYEGRGLGRAAAAALCEVAASNGVGCVVAHTLPEESASTSILKGLGFARSGEVVDPDDGLVWRWERRS